MIRVNREPRQAIVDDLQRVIEPLASYICATDQPRAVLNLAFSALFNEVEQLHHAAKVDVTSIAATTSEKTAEPVDFAGSCATPI